MCNVIVLRIRSEILLVSDLSNDSFKVSTISLEKLVCLACISTTLLELQANIFGMEV